MTKYYAINGDNGVCVADNWGFVLKTKMYFKAHQVRKFNSFKSAEEYALNTAKSMMSVTIELPSQLKCHDIQFSKNLPKKFKPKLKELIIMLD